MTLASIQDHSIVLCAPCLHATVEPQIIEEPDGGSDTYAGSIGPMIGLFEPDGAIKRADPRGIC